MSAEWPTAARSSAAFSVSGPTPAAQRASLIRQSVAREIAPIFDAVGIRPAFTHPLGPAGGRLTGASPGRLAPGRTVDVDVETVDTFFTPGLRRPGRCRRDD